MIYKLNSNHYLSKKIYLILILWIFQLLLLPNAKQFKFGQITIADGLPSNSIFCITQDQQGFLWFGTRNGLVRYDGYHLKVFKNDDTPGSIKSNLITALLIDNKGKLWAGTHYGLNAFHKDTLKFNNYLSDSNNAKSLSDNKITVLFEDSKERLWVGTDYGLNLFNSKNITFERFIFEDENKKGTLGSKIVMIGEDSAGELWVASKKGIYLFDDLNQEFLKFSPQGEPNSQFENLSSCTMTKQKTELWLSYKKKGLIKFDIKTRVFSDNLNLFTGDLKFKNSSLNHIFEDKAGRMWISTEDGLYHQDSSDQKEYMFKHDPQNILSLSQNNVQTVFEDKSGNIWVGTMGGGINKLSKNSGSFYNIKEGNNPDLNLTNQIVRSILEDKKGNLWIGTENGLSFLDKKRNKFSYYQDVSLNNSNMFMSIIEDHKDNLWLGTYGEGLKIFDRQKKTFKTFKKVKDDDQALSGNTINILYQDSMNTLWIGTNKGLNIYDYKTGKFPTFSIQTESNHSISGLAVNSIVEDLQKRIWIGTARGLISLKQDDGIYSQDEDVHLKNVYIISILDAGQDLWLGTFDWLIRFQKTTHLVSKYGVKEGLSGSMIKGILEDNKQNLWLSTNNGLSKFNPRDKTFINYFTTDGTQNDEYNTRAFHKGSDGRMYFGGMKGLTMFYPSEIQINRQVPRIVLTDFLLFNEPVKPGLKSVLTNDISATEEIKLKHNQNYFSFEFSALDFTNPAKNQYKYKLSGVDVNWIFCNADQRMANYQRVAPGEYLFTVMGSNNDGVWNDKGTFIKIIIDPPFWKTWWFILLSVLIGIFLLVYYYKKRLKKLELKLREENQIEVLCVKYQITKREREIIDLILQGKDNREIEGILFISYYTVKNHISNIYNKIGVKNRGDLIVFFKSSHPLEKK